MVVKPIKITTIILNNRMMTSYLWNGAFMECKL